MSDNKSLKEKETEVSKGTVEDAAFALAHMQANPSLSVSLKDSNKIDTESKKALKSSNICEHSAVLQNKTATKVPDISDYSAKDSLSSTTIKTVETTNFNEAQSYHDQNVSSNLTQQYDNVLTGIMERMKGSDGEKNSETTIWEQKFFLLKEMYNTLKEKTEFDNKQKATKTMYQNKIAKGGSRGSIRILDHQKDTIVDSVENVMKEKEDSSEDEVEEVSKNTTKEQENLSTKETTEVVAGSNCDMETEKKLEYFVGKENQDSSKVERKEIETSEEMNNFKEIYEINVGDKDIKTKDNDIEVLHEKDIIVMEKDVVIKDSSFREEPTLHQESDDDDNIGNDEESMECDEDDNDVIENHEESLESDSDSDNNDISEDKDIEVIHEKKQHCDGNRCRKRR